MTARIVESKSGLLGAGTMRQEHGVVEVTIPQVGVLVMVRFQKFTIGWAWEVIMALQIIKLSLRTC